MSTAESEEAIQQMQVQQQQNILQAQQLLEQQQQQEQKEQLLAMAQNLQQHVEKHKKPHRHSGAHPEVTESPEVVTTTFPTYQTVSASAESSDKPGQDAFPITLTESFDSSHKVRTAPAPSHAILLPRAYSS